MPKSAFLRPRHGRHRRKPPRVAVRSAILLAVLALIAGAAGGLLPVIARAAQTFQSVSGNVATMPSGLTATFNTTSVDSSNFVNTAGAGTISSGSTYFPSGMVGKPAETISYGTNARAADQNGNEVKPIGTLTVTFSRPVVNPVLSLASLGAGNRDALILRGVSIHPELTLTSGQTLTKLAGFDNEWTITSTTIKPTNNRMAYQNAGTAPDCGPRFDSILAPNASGFGCGSVRVNGTVSTLTFDVDGVRDFFVSGTPPTTDTFYMAVSADEDCSKAPTSYGAASHIVSNLALGAKANVDNSDSLSTTACRSDSSARDANPTFPELTAASAGSTYQVTVPVSNGAGGATSDASELAGWIDFNGNGTFDDGERATVAVPAGSTSATLSWTVPTDVKAGSTWARFRLGYNTAQTDAATGMADSGEVEDYPVTIAAGPSLHITKTMSPTAPLPGSTVTYTINAQNTGDTTYNADLTDDLSGVLDDASVVGTPTATIGTATITGTSLHYTGAIPAGQTATITYQVRVGDPPGGDKTLKNHVTSNNAGTNCDAGSTDAACSTSAGIPALHITKSLSPAQPAPGDTVTYTVAVQNTGTAPYPNAAFHDDLSGVLDDATFVGTPTASIGTATFTSPTLSWTGDIPAGQTATITYQVRINDPDTGDKVLNNTVVADVPGTNCPAGSTDPDCTGGGTTPPGVANLVITKTANPTGPVKPGDSVTYTITAHNNGAATYTGAHLTDDLSGIVDDATLNGTPTADSGTVAYDPATHVLDWTGDIPAGDTATITYTVTVNNPPAGDKVLTNTVVSAGPGTNCAAGSADPACSGPTIDIAQLHIAKSATPTNPAPGDTVTYTVTVQNTGTGTYTGATFTDDLSGVVDDATFTGTPTATTGTATYNPVTHHLTWNGDVPAGDTATITYQVVVDNPPTGDATLHNVVTSTADTNCATGSTDAACSTTIGLPVLQIMKTASPATPVPGGTVTYTVTVKNPGTTPYPGATFTDDLSGVLDDATFTGTPTADVGTASFDAAGSSLTWTGDLAPGATATITYQVTVDDPPAGDGVLTNKITSTSPGSNCGAGSTDPACTTSVGIPSLHITKSVSPSNPRPGDTVTYTVAVENTGSVDYPNAAFHDDLSGVLDDATFEGTPTATSGTASFTSPTLSWTGNVPAGETVTVTYQVRINDPDTGDKILHNTVVADVPGTNCAAGSTDPDCTGGGTNPPGIPTLHITKTASTTNPLPGEPVTYTVTVQNTGTATYPNAAFHDDLSGVLDDATFEGEPTATSGTVSYTEPTVSWNGDIPAGETVTITYTVTVNDPDTGDGVLRNTVVADVPGTNCPAGSTDPDCSGGGTTPPGVPSLHITKSVSPTNPLPGDVVTYTVTVTNTSTADYTGAAFHDDLSGVLDDATFVPPATATSGTASFTSPTLSWTGDVPAGQTVTVTYRVRVNDPDTGDKVLNNTVVADTPNTNCPAGSTDPDCTGGGTNPPGIPTLHITKTASTTNPLPGEPVTYTVTVENTGTADYTGAAFHDDLSGVLDDATFEGEPTASSGTVSYTEPTVSWNGNVPVGETVTITYTVRVNDPDTGDGVLRNTVVADVPGTNCPAGSTDPDCSGGGTTPPGVPSLHITKSLSPTNPLPGDVVTYTVTVENTSTADYTGAAFHDDLSGVLDDATFVPPATATSGTATFTSPTLSWTGDVPAGQTVTVTYRVRINDPDTGDKVLNNTVVADTPNTNCPAGSTDPDCTGGGTNPPGIPTLHITKTASTTNPLPGQTVTYTVTVENTGTAPYPNAAFHDDLSGVLDDATFQGEPTATSGTVSYTAPTVSWNGDIPAGETVTITYAVTVNDPDTGDGVLRNTVVADVPGTNCPAGSTDPDCSGGGTTPPGVPALHITKSLSPTTPLPGDVVTYTVTLENTGTADYTGAAFHDDLSGVLDDATFIPPATATSGTATFTSPTLSWTGDVPAGQTVTVTYRVRINDPDTGDKVLNNTVVADTPNTNCPAGSTDPDCTGGGTTPPGIPTLHITKSASTTTPLPGDTVTYTVTVENTGTADYPNAAFHDDLSGVLDDATFEGEPTATSGTVTYTEPTVHWTGNIPAGQTVTITYTVRVNDPDTGDKTLNNTVVADVPGTNCPEGSTDPDCSGGGTTPPGIATLHITKSLSPANPLPGQVVTYTVAVENTGTADYPNAAFHDDLSGVLDDATFIPPATATSGTATFTSPTLSWTGNVPAGQTVTVTYHVRINDPDTGDKVLNNTVVADVPGTNCPAGSTDPDCTGGGTTPPGIPTLHIVKTPSTTSVLPGEPVTYTVTVENTGTAPYPNAAFHDDLSGVLDDATFEGEPTATSGTATFTSPTLSWTGDIPAGETVTITYTVRVNDPDTGDKTLNNKVIADVPGTNCPAGSTDPDCSGGPTPPGVPALHITKSLSPTNPLPGDTVTYTVTVENTGTAPYTNAAFHDDLSGVLDDAAFQGEPTATSGTATFTSPTLSWTGDIPAGETVTVTYQVKINDPDTGDKILNNTIVADVPNTNCPAGSTDPDCTGGGTTPPGIPTLHITKSASTTTPLPGDTVTYTVTVENTGTADYPNASFHDDLSGVLDDATFEGEPTATSGTVTYTEPTVHWTGNVPAGQTVTITYTVRVNDPDTGDKVLNNTVVADVPGTNCPEGSTDPDCSGGGTTPPGIATLHITKSLSPANPLPGQVVTYTVAVENTGTADYPNAAFHDDLTGVLDDATFIPPATATSGTATFTSPTLSWTGDVPAGQTVTVTYHVRINDPDTGDKILNNTVVADVPGTNCPEGSTDPDCTGGGTTPPGIPTLHIVKTPSTTTVVPGETVTYTVTVENTGTADYPNAALHDDLSGVLDDATFEGEPTATSGTVSYTEPTLSWNGDVPAGQTVTITYTVRVNDPDTGDKTLNNQVVADVPGTNCPVGSTDPDCSGGPTPPGIATLHIKKSLSPANPLPGDVVTYTVTVENTGTVDYPNASFHDDLSGVLDDATFEGTPTATSGTATFTNPTLSWTGNVPAGATETITYQVRVNDPDTGDKILNNTVVADVPGTNCSAGSTDPDCTGGGTTPPGIPTLHITKSASTTTPLPGDTVTYTVTVENTGTADYPNAAFHDDLSGVLDDATFEGEPTATSGTVTYTEPTVHWTGNIPAGETVTITYTVRVNDPDTGDKVLNNTVVADVPGTNCPAGSTDPDCTGGGTTPPGIPTLHIKKTASTTNPLPGDVVTYTVTVQNTGTADYPNASFHDDLSGVLDDATFEGEPTATSGTVTYTEPTVRWNGNIPAGETVTITYQVRVNDPDTGDKVLNNTVVADVPGTNCPAGSTDPDCSGGGTTPPGVPTLHITKSVSPTNPLPGGLVTYTVTVENTGTADYPNAAFHDDLSGVLDDATFIGQPTASSGTASYTAPTVSWTGNVPAGETVTVHYVVRVNDPDTGDKVLHNTVVADVPGTNCPAGSTDPDCTGGGTTPPGIPTLHITKTPSTTSVVPGDTVTYTVTVKNTGTADYPNAAFHDDLSGVLDDATFEGEPTATSGTVSYTEPTVSWHGDVPAGQTVTITYTVRVNDPDTGDKTLNNQVVADVPGTNCPPGSTDPDCSGGPTPPGIATLHITKSLSPTNPLPGDLVTYTVTVENTGTVDYPNASFHDDLSGVLDDATFEGTPTATSGTATFTSPTLSWTGNVPAGATETITYQVRINDPDTGDKILNNTVVADVPGTNCSAGSTDPDCTGGGTTPPGIPTLHITKSASTTTPLPGDLVTYTVTVENTGTADYPNAAFHDDLSGVLDDATFEGEPTATSGTVTYTEPTVRWAGNVAAGETVTITYTVRVNDPDTGDKVLNNTVVADVPGTNCPAGSTDPDCSGGGTTPPGIATLHITKSLSPTNPLPGDLVTYTVTVENTGTADYPNASFHDDLSGVLDDATFEGTPTATSGTATFTSPTLSWTGNVPAGATETITYQVRVNDPDTGDKILNNTVVADVPGTNCPAGSTDPDCTGGGTTPPGIPTLHITKTPSTTTVIPGDTVTYTVTVENTGTADYPNASFHDDLSGVLDDATFEGEPTATSGTVTYVEPTVSWNGNVPAGETVTITYTVRVNDPDTGDKTLNNQVVADVPGTNCPPGSTDPDCSGGPTPPGIATLHITKSLSPTNPLPGDLVTYTVTVENTGTVDYPNAAFHDDLSGVLDDATFIPPATATSGTATFTSPTLSWTGDVPAGATETITYHVRINDPDTGDKVLNNTIVADVPGTNCPEGSTDPDCTGGGTNPPGIPTLHITKAASTTTPLPGDTVTYTVTVENTGTADYPNAAFHDDLSGVLDDATFQGEPTATSGTVSYAEPTVSWHGDVPAGATVTITYTVRVNDPDTGDKVLNNTVVADVPGTNCPAGSTDPDCSDGGTTPPGIATLHITKSLSPTNPLPGDVVTYTVTVENTGTADYPNASFHDDLSGVLDDATFQGEPTATTGTATFTSPTLSWTGDVPAGATETITYQVKINDPDTGDKVLNNTVVADVPGTNCPEGSTDPDCTGGGTTPPGIPTLHITKTPSTTTVIPGDTVTYTVTVENTGTADYPNASFHDDLSGVLDDATFEGEPTATSGTVSYTEPTVSWHGDVPAGQTVTITYTVRVNDPDTGDKTLNNQVVADVPGTNCPPGSTDPDCSGGPTPPGIATLHITKSLSPTNPVPGDVVTYTVTVENTGTVDYPNASFHDDLSGVLDDATFQGTPTATSGTATFTSPTLSWTGDVPAGATETITYQVRVNDPDTGDKVLNNTVVADVPGTNCGAGSTDPDCTGGGTTPPGIPTLHITKTPSTTTVVPGDTVTYTVTVQNTGTADYTNAAFHDDLSGVLDDATFEGEPTATSGTVFYNEPTVSWHGDVPAGQTVTITYTVRINDPDTGDKTLNNQVVADVPGTNCPEGSTDPDCSGGPTPPGIATLHIKKSLSPTNPVPGDVVTYTVTVENTGTVDYPNASFHDDLSGVLDDATFTGQPTATTGTVTFTSPTLSWTGNVPAGATETITYQARINDPDTGDKVLNNTVVADVPGTNCPAGSTDPDCTGGGTNPPGIPTLHIVKTPSTTTVVPGDTVTYTVTVQNTGTADYTNASFHDELSGVLDDATFEGEPTATSGTVTYTEPTLSWHGDVPAGQTVTITYTVRINDPDTGDKTLNNQVVADVPGTNCPEGSTDPDCSGGPTPPGIATLHIKKSLSPTNPLPGGLVTYTVTVENTGTVDYPNASFHDDLSGVLDDAAFIGQPTASSGTASYTAPTVSWTGDVPAGETVTITYHVRVNDPDTGDKVLHNTVVADVPGTNCPAGSTDPDCTGGGTTPPGIPTLHITKTPSTTTVVPGDTVTYTVTVRNTGTADYPNAAFHDDLSGVLDDATLVGEPTATSGTVSYTEPTVSWHGDVPAGETVTITYTVRINDPDTGDRVLKNQVVADVPGTNCPEGSTDPDCSAGPTPPGIATLHIKKSLSPTNPLPGDTVTYTVTVENTGTVDYPNASFHDDLSGVLDDATFQGTPTATSGTAAFAAPTLTWHGDVPAGQRVTVTYQVKVNDPVTGDGTLRNTVVADVPGTNCSVGSTDPDCSGGGTNPPGIPSLHITKTPSTTSAAPGDTVTYTVTVKNTGAADYPNASFHDDLSGVLDDATLVGQPTASTGRVNFTSPTVSWTGDIPAGATVTITYQVRVNDPDTGDRALRNTVVADVPGTNCPAGSASGACTSCVEVTVTPPTPPHPHPTNPTVPPTRHPHHPGKGGLPRTGEQILLIAGSAAALLALGALGVVVGRRRGRHLR